MLHTVLLGVIAGVTFAFARGFAQAAIDDWHRWRMEGREVVINDKNLAADDVFLDELEVAVRRSLERRQK